MTRKETAPKKRRKARGLLVAGTGLAVAFLSGCPQPAVGTVPMTSDLAVTDGGDLGVAPMNSDGGDLGVVGIGPMNSDAGDLGVVGIGPMNSDAGDGGDAA